MLLIPSRMATSPPPLPPDSKFFFFFKNFLYQRLTHCDFRFYVINFWRGIPSGRTLQQKSLLSPKMKYSVSDLPLDAGIMRAFRNITPRGTMDAFPRPTKCFLWGTKKPPGVGWFPHGAYAFFSFCQVMLSPPWVF